jgi:hypothetical protein
MMMTKMIGTVDGEAVVGEENVVGERVERTMIAIMIMITARMMAKKMEVIKTGKVIVAENNIEKNAAKIVG